MPAPLHVPLSGPPTQVAVFGLASHTPVALLHCWHWLQVGQGCKGGGGVGDGGIENQWGRICLAGPGPLPPGCIIKREPRQFRPGVEKL